MKLASEGYPFIAAFGALTLLCIFFVPWIAILPALLTGFMVYFFRDPDRNTPSGPDLFVSSADGEVILVEAVDEDCHLQSKATLVSIFMSPLDVHVNRAPCDGIVESVVHTPGKFHKAFKREACMYNENIALVLKTDYGKILVRQVAGFLARRAVCKVKPGDTLARGERFGMIKFSSRVDMYFPEEVTITVRVGDKVKAGETIVAVREKRDAAPR